MTTAELEATAAFATALTAASRSSDIPESGDLYGGLIGSWELDVFDYGVSGDVQRGRGEVHFGWVLEGRAVQDVWIMPGRNERPANPDRIRNRYGTTLRVWDASIRAWRVTWINPVTGARNELIGRRDGRDLVQLGTHADGTPIRWIFTDLTPDSFRWIGEALQSDGKTWKLEAEFHGRRMA